jgi:hypothetical protein
MSDKEKPTHTMPGGSQQENSEADNGVVNDSLGKIDPADTTGTGEDNQPCEKPEARRSTGPGPQHRRDA